MPPMGGSPPYGQPAHGTPPIPRAPGRAASRRFVAAVAAVVALVLVAGGILVWQFALKDDGGDGGSPVTDGKTMKHAWKTPPGDGRVETLGAWTSGQRVITGDAKAITAYDIADGREAGRFTPPTGEFCGMATKASQGIGIAAYGPAGKCDMTVAIDLATMRSAWERKSKDVANSDDKFRRVQTAVDGDIAVISTSTGLSAFNLKDGAKRWDWSPTSSDDEGVDGLRVEGGTVLVEQSSYEKQSPANLIAIDAADGSRRWSKSIPPADDGYAWLNLVHADPVVVEIARGGDYILQSYDRDGKLRAEIPSHGPDGMTDPRDMRSAPYNSDFDSAPYYSVAVAKNTLYIKTERRDQKLGEIVRLVAFDLGTGKARWSMPMGKDVADIEIVGTDASGVLVLGTGLPGAPGQLMAFKHEDGSSLGARAVDGRALLDAADSAIWMLSEGRLIGFTWLSRPEVPGLVGLA
ncbi:outer membrane protein assembly factor BamB family protein [Yinghuangia soli]|uniref:PQQ-like beta-propeller repeat protein n=1 Tax=Yinghuangia soli TaxID=2908204 RepID=A0AA41Q7J2_9ACTN|nr:PQQ-binding-like beta-propeller repeat protein [Yinghuangia soli]MCF2533050.1 PQQ-like beta-propeller repeat protein [Yinghuangia soli]